MATRSPRRSGCTRRSAKAEALRIASDALARVELPESRFPLTLYPHELSGGQRQRVGIAMAIALRPRLLIADEPTTALDVTTQAQILDLLKRLVEEDQMGLLLITHDLAVVAGLAHRIAIMRDGEVVESGETGEVFRAMRHPYTRALFEASRHQPVRLAPEIEPDAVPVLDVSGVVRDYPLAREGLFAPRRHFRAVDGVSFVIYRGENVGLVGESGCGKSTLSRAILALEGIQAGHIRIEGEPVGTGASFAARRKMQIVFQDPYGSFNPRQRVSRLVSEPFHLLGAEAPTGAEREKRIAEALDKVGLSAADADKFIHEFSGGQRQRIAIARALIIHPALIVLDEAVSALDVSIRAQILDLLADLSDRMQLSYLFISHDLTVVRSITDRVLVMKSGKIVEEGGDRSPLPESAASLHPATHRRRATSRPGIGGPRHYGRKQWLTSGSILRNVSSTGGGSRRKLATCSIWKTRPDGTTICAIARGYREDVDAAVAAARSALSSDWGALPAFERGRILTRIGQMVLERIDVLSEMEAMDVGKPLKQARNDRHCPGPLHGILWRGRRQGDGRDHSFPQRVHRLHHARAAWRDRPYRAVELPDADHRPLGRRRLGHGQLPPF